MRYADLKNRIMTSDSAAPVWHELIGAPLEVFQDVSFHRRGGVWSDNKKVFSRFTFDACPFCGKKNHAAAMRLNGVFYVVCDCLEGGKIDILGAVQKKNNVDKETAFNMILQCMIYLGFFQWEQKKHPEILKYDPDHVADDPAEVE